MAGRQRAKKRKNHAISGEALFNLLQVDGGSPIASPGLISNPHTLSITAHLPLGLRNRPQIACMEGKSTPVLFSVACSFHFLLLTVALPQNLAPTCKVFISFFL